jgi:hypothetical protein
MMFDIDVERLYQSKTWLIAAADLKPWLLRLWVESWRSIPVGTFDDDDELIAARIMMPEALFQAHRKTLMRGWVRHSDGLLYHPVITELVINLVTWRDRERDRKRAYRERMSRGTDAGQVGQIPGQVGQDDTSSSSSSSSSLPKSAPKRFVAPTIDQVAAYIAEKGYTFSADRFVAFYESKGWKIGKSPMKSWQAACKTWQANQTEQQPAQPPARKKKSFDELLAGGAA